MKDLAKIALLANTKDEKILLDEGFDQVFVCTGNREELNAAVEQALMNHAFSQNENQTSFLESVTHTMGLLGERA